MGVKLTLTPREDPQRISSDKMNCKVLIAVFTTIQFVVGDKVPVYSGGQAGFGGNAAQDAFNALGEAIPGEPGEDYPIYSEVPETSFTCDGQVEGGYYSDPEAECQAFHICGWWFNVDCSQAEDFYSLNDEIAAEREANSPGQGQYDGQGSQGRSSGSKGSSKTRNSQRSQS